MTKTLEGHADQRFDGELHALHLNVLEMGSLALDQSRVALQALMGLNKDLAQKVLDREPTVDSMEDRIDNSIVDLMTKRGPVSRDLRITIAFSKIVVDLERIGDEAAKIAHIVESLSDENQPKPAKNQMRDISNMGKLALGMLDTAMKSLSELDAQLAETLLNTDQDLDMEFQSSLRHLTTFVLEDARNLGHTINITLMLKSLERLGAHAGNIAEYVIYLVYGVNVRDERRSGDK
ncbi:MAG: phosphate transport system regulatory protein PhoU [Cycloclasticus sp.]|nr:phosphate transport system regulatory protein PhoU [Cycloclasticus sp.]MBG95374.1 phosphate transport system regulatory protein PhoU [Cycloclasticus sp.]HAI97136.1 phosphate transport system regulatory protein PhoU [Methylococcaceae bacterium]|tara:strand:+ start:1347 stop:2051 length:705 start_codon:yes stop_codon:yes gene_type:complete